MLLSEAIAMGRVLIEPAAGNLGSVDEKRGCALGMAGRAAGMRTTRNRYLDLVELFPQLEQQKLTGPCTCNHMKHRGSLGAAIVHVFDTHVMYDCDWTLDQLIDWVRSVEPAEPKALPLETLRKIGDAIEEEFARCEAAEQAGAR